MAKQKAKTRDDEPNRVTLDRRNSPIRVVANWEHTQGTTPAFRRLVMLLLRLQENRPVEVSQTDEEHQNEQ